MSWLHPDLLRSRSAPRIGGAEPWRRALLALEADGPFGLAVRGAHRAESVGWAFAFGYQAALRALLPAHAPGRLAALCATEAGGNHPRAIETTLADGVLHGTKSFVTLGPMADLLVVIAREGVDPDGRPRLVACLVDPTAPGVEVTASPPLPVVPEIPHGQLRMTGVRPTVVLPGDGYTRTLKPFRTVEDAHVHAALTAWLVGVAVEAGWPPEEVEAALVVLSALAAVAAADPSEAPTHRLLGGALAAFRALVDRIEPHWETAPAGLREMWARDRALMRIASGARRARLTRARGG